MPLKSFKESILKKIIKKNMKIQRAKWKETELYGQRNSVDQIKSIKNKHK